MADEPKRVTSVGSEAAAEGKPPTPETVAKAVGDSGGTEGGRVMKVLYVDDDGNTVGQWASHQMPEDPFGARNIAGLMDPPYKLEQMVYLAEQHPVHCSALDQKTVDICGTGWDWEPQGDMADADADAQNTAREELAKWWTELADYDESMEEVVSAAWDDVETTGWGLIEVVRDPQGKVKRLYHVPGHTVRAHRDGIRLVQMRGQFRIWFKRWGAVDAKGEPYEVDAKTGSLKVVREPATDLLVIKKKSRRSTWYGIPGYVSAIGYLALALSARDDNINYFNNRREPRWAIILSNLEDNPKIEDDIRRAFTVDLKQPHRNIVIPIAGDGKIDFQQLSGKNGPADGSFIQLAEHCDKKILIGHRIPAERLANTTVGALGGTVTDDANRVYKEGVVAPSQHLYETRLNKFVAVEYKLETGNEAQFKLVLDDLDLDEDKAEADYILGLWKSDLITLGEARDRLGWDPLQVVPTEIDPDTGEEIEGNDGNPEDSPYNNKLYTELPGVSKGSITPQQAGAANDPSGLDDQGDTVVPPGADGSMTQKRTAIDMALLRGEVAEMLASGRRTEHALQELAESQE